MTAACTDTKATNTNGGQSWPSRGAVSAEQVHFYRDQGYLLVPGVFSPHEAETFRAEAQALAQRIEKLRGMEDPTWSTVRTGRTTIQHCHDVQFYSALFCGLMLDPRFTGLAQALIGPNVQLHHNKMFIKPPEKGSPFPMHQDYYYFPHRHDSMIAAIVHFDASTEEKGCVRVVPGSHKLGPLKPAASDNSLSADEYPIEKAVPCVAGPGDVLFFSYLTIHGSGINASNSARTTLLVQMRDPTDQPLDHQHKSRGQGMMLAGIDPSCGATQPPTA